MSIGLIFVWQFSNFVCVLLAAMGLGYPSLPSKLGNLVRWGSLYAFPMMLSYVVTDLRLYGRPSPPGLVKTVRALRYLLWLWLVVALVSLIAEGTRIFPASDTLAGHRMDHADSDAGVLRDIDCPGTPIAKGHGLVVPLGRVRRAGLIASGVSAVLLSCEPGRRTGGLRTS